MNASASSPPESLPAPPDASPETPWLGLSHFTEHDRKYFFGRSEEIRDLTSRVRLASLTVIYGVSGYGKSSLLGAGLIPVLNDLGHQVLLLRRCYDDLATRRLETDVIEAAMAAIPGCDWRDDGPPGTLWEFFHDARQPWFRPAPPAAQTSDASEAPPTARRAPTYPVLIFDQFEEIFTKGEDFSDPDPAAQARMRQAATAFLHNLADLVENRPPASLRDRLEAAEPAEQRALARQFEFQSRAVRVVIAIRDDFLARLERFRRVMPSIMDHRVELRMLAGPEALKAVFEPGKLRGDRPPIIPEDIAARIVRAAANAEPEVPLAEIDAVPPILSLLCERLNARRRAAGGDSIADFAPEEAHDILETFYEEKMGVQPRPLREYLERELASDTGLRETVGLEATLKSLELEVPDVEKRLQQLVNGRVLVIENRGGIPRLELTHDTLARLAVERRAERQARARRIKALWWSGVCMAIAGASIALTLWALNEARRANDREEETRALVRFMEAQMAASRTDVPLLLRERVSDRVADFYASQGERNATFADRSSSMARHVRHASVHLEEVLQYQKRDQKRDFNRWVQQDFIQQEQNAAAADLQAALQFGEQLAREAPDDRRITRDRILTYCQLSALHRQLQDIEGAAAHLQHAQSLLDALVKEGPLSTTLFLDWMGLPNLDELRGDLEAERGDRASARHCYEKALALQQELVRRSPDDQNRKKELAHIQNCLPETAP